jgi:hypothetical protein
MFRDENPRILRRFHAKGTGRTRRITCPSYSKTVSNIPQMEMLMFLHGAATIVRSPCQPMTALAAHFYFNTYLDNNPPLSNSFNFWLAKNYWQKDSSRPLRTAIEAVGLVGMSNFFHSPQIAEKANERYCVALAATNCALKDPAEAIADQTLMAILIMLVFEVDSPPTQTVETG